MSDSDYAKFFVTNKIALYSHDFESVLIMEYPVRGIWGLPGGHLDPGETPEVAMARELLEELNVTVDNIEKVDFYVRNLEEVDSSLVLAYKAIAPPDFETHPTDPEKEYAIWVKRADIPNVGMHPSYKKFVRENWPSAI